MRKLRIVLAQLDLFVGDIHGNLDKLIGAAKTARDKLKADVIVFPELATTGYPPDDLLLRKSFIDESTAALYEFKSQVKDIYCVVGHPHANSSGLYNSCSLIYNDTILGRYAKQHLPNYGVFDERRYFTPGTSSCVIPIHGVPVGLVICEDLWFKEPCLEAANAGARIILSPNASPFEMQKHQKRVNVLSKHARLANVPIVYVNCVGAQDELVFDGGSMVLDQEGQVCKVGGFFKEELIPIDVELTSLETKIPLSPTVDMSDEQKMYEALTLGVRDYVKKNKIPGVYIGVSGGIDSALTLAIAVDALGKDKVSAIIMPSRYTASMSMDDGLALVKNLDVDYEIISIEPTFKQFIETLSPSLYGKKSDITEQNIQARCRGIILMALANHTGRIVLTTGNRSEMAVGYCTLYGDMAGGLGVLKDVPKTWVYRLARYRNELEPVIPQRTIERPPTAELAPDQKDQDSLPDYDTLDRIIELYINQRLGVQEIIDKGMDEETVINVVKLINRNEHKRRQAPIGIRVNHTAFSRDRRYPITSGFKG